MKSNGLNTSKHFGGILGLNQTYLEVCACGNLAVTARQILCCLGKAAKLIRFHDPSRNSKTRHKGVPHRRQIKKAVQFESISLLLVRRLVASRIFKEAIVRVERVLLILNALLRSELDFLLSVFLLDAGRSCRALSFGEEIGKDDRTLRHPCEEAGQISRLLLV
jgi:hypothetical protein